MLDARHTFDQKSQCYKALDTRDYIILIQFFKLLLVSMSCFMDVSVDCGCFIGQSSFNCSRVFCFYNIEIAI